MRVDDFELSPCRQEAEATLNKAEMCTNEVQWSESSPVFRAAEEKSFGLFLHENSQFENYFLQQERDLVILRSMMVG